MIVSRKLHMVSLNVCNISFYSFKSGPTEAVLFIFVQLPDWCTDFVVLQSSHLNKEYGKWSLSQFFPLTATALGDVADSINMPYTCNALMTPATVNLNNLSSVILDSRQRGYTRICAEQMASSWPRPLLFCSFGFVFVFFFPFEQLAAGFPQTHRHLFTRIYKQFQNNSVKMVSTCWQKGSSVHWPCLMRFHWGRVTRRRVFLGSQLAEWDIVWPGGTRTC